MTDYYVSNTGSDAANGLTTSTPWLTVAKVNGFTFTAGDHVYFQRGGRWYETLTVPRNTLNFGAYGAAAIFDDAQYDIRGAAKGYCTNAPIIDGGQFVTGWTDYNIIETPFQDSLVDTAGVDLTAHVPDVAGSGWQLHLVSPSKHLIFTASNRVRRSSTASATYYNNNLSGANDYGVECPLHFASSLANDAAYVYLRGQTGSSELFYAVKLTSTVVEIVRFSFSPAGATLATTGFTPVAGTTYLARLEVHGATLTAYVDGVLKLTVTDTAGTAGAAVFPAGQQSGLRLGGASAGTQADGTGWQAGGNTDDFKVNVFDTSTPVYKATGITVRPRIVDAFQTYYKEGNSLQTLSDGQWIWDDPSDTLYVCNSAVGSVSNTDVVINARNNCVVGAGKTDITFEDLAFEHAGAATVSFSSGGARAVVRRCYVQRSTKSYRGSGEVLSGNIGTLSFVGANNPIVEYCVVRNVGGEAIWPDCLDGTLSYNRLGPCHEWSSDCIHSEHTGDETLHIGHTVVGNHMTMLGSTSIKGCVILFGADHVVTDNYFENANWGFIAVGDDVVISRNVGYNLSSFIKLDDHVPGQILDGIQIDHNIGIDCGFGILSTSSGGTAARTNLTVVANTILNIARVPTFQFRADDNISGVFKDNLLWNTSGAGGVYKVTSLDAAGWDSNNNLLGPEAAGFVNYTGVAHATLAAYVAAASQDSRSIKATPVFKGLGDPTGVDEGEYYRTPYRAPQYRAGVPVTGVTSTGGQDMGALPNTDGYWGIPA